MGIQESDELSGIDKAVFDIYKHVTTLCSASVVVLAAFLTRYSPDFLRHSDALRVAVVGFGICIILGVAGMCFVVKEHQQMADLAKKLGKALKKGQTPDVQELAKFIAGDSALASMYKKVSETLFNHTTIKRGLVGTFGLSMCCLLWFILSVTFECGGH